ncbi:MAG: hypothetical protein HOP08_05045 [Cyclobacteriaceae bacterium]|nr:hypothetical protein [Cyclobacteriaceae bacterium]
MNYFILSIILVVSTFLQTAAQTDCDLKVDKNGIKVYTCELKNSKFKSVKASFELESTLSQFAAAVLDIDRYKEWQYKTLEAMVLKKVSNGEVIYYTEAAAPILTSNRDFVIKLTVNQNQQTKDLQVDLVSLPKYIPEKENVIRVPYSKAQYTVKALSASRLKVDYYIEIDLGGSVPAWMVNSVAPQAPYETFKDLKKIIGEYKNKGVSFVLNQ